MPTSRPTSLRRMDGSIGAYEAKAKLSELLDRVERGEAITITRRGQVVARLVPPGPDGPAPSPEAVIEAFRAFREKLRREGRKPFNVDEILELRDAGCRMRTPPGRSPRSSAR